MLRQLRELVLVRCGIEELMSDTFSFVPQLRRLDLRHNRIQHISGNQFRGISELEYLLLSDNPLVELGEDAFRGLTVGRLEIVNSPSLRQIADTAFHSARVLTLVMYGCGLERLTKAAIQHIAESLRDLVISNNTRTLGLDADVFAGFHLRRMVLTNDRLSGAGFLAHGDHDEIVLDNNDQLWSTAPAPSTPRAKLERKRTRRLSLHNTSMPRIVDFSMFPDVEELNLSSNRLRTVAAVELLPLERLRVLDLSNNSIEQFVGNFTSALLRLDTLDLRNNSLETLPEPTWRPLLERLKSAILFQGNRLHYNCEMRWLAEQETLLLGEDDGSSSFLCEAPEIRNASVLVTEDQVYVVCEAVGDPAPRVSWSTDSERMLTHVEPSSTRRRDAFSTRSQLAVTRLANYTCTASNLLGHITATVDLTDTLRSSPHAWQTMKRRAAQLEIISTPLGFTLTLASIALLAYLLKQY